MRMEHEGNLLRGFPVRVILKPCDAHPSKTTVIGLQSKTVVVNTAADCQTTLRLAPKDEYGNPVGPQVIYFIQKQNADKTVKMMIHIVIHDR